MIGVGLGIPWRRGGAGGGGGGGGDPHFSNVVLLVHFDGEDGATTATDESNSAHTLTFGGNCEIDTAQSKFGGASLLCPSIATSDVVTAPDSADWLLMPTTNDQFTIELWYRPNFLASNHCLISQWATTGNQRAWQLMAEHVTAGDPLVLRYSTDGADFPTLSANLSWTTTQWYHIAVDYDGTTIRLYRDGTMVESDTPTGAMFDSSAALNIGRRSQGDFVTNGWIDEVRITKGVARYASDSGFDVPTEAFPNE